MVYRFKPLYAFVVECDVTGEGIWYQPEAYSGALCYMDNVTMRGTERMAGTWQPVAVLSSFLNTTDIYIEQFWW